MIPRRTWQPLTGILKPTIIRQFLGISKGDKYSLANEYFVSASNVTSQSYPSLEVRKPLKLLSGGNVTGVGKWKDNMLQVIADGVWKHDNKVIMSGLNGTEWSFTNFKGNWEDVRLLATNEEDGTYMFDGTTLTKIDLDNIIQGQNLKYIDSHDNRVYGATGNTVFFTALRKGEDWGQTVEEEETVRVPVRDEEGNLLYDENNQIIYEEVVKQKKDVSVEDSGQIVVETTDGTEITGIVAGPGHLVVFKKNYVFELYGTGPHNYQMKEISSKIGCVAHRSAVMVNGVLYFLGENGVYRYTGGVAPKKDFAEKIQPIIDSINKDRKEYAVAGTDGKNYYLAIPQGNSLYPNIVLEYSPQKDIWYTWEIPNVKDIVSTTNGMYIGTNTGLYELSNDTTNQVEWEVITKPFGTETMIARHRWYRLWVVADVPEGSTMEIFISSDGEVWEKVKSITEGQELMSQIILLPVDLFILTPFLQVKIKGTGYAKIYELSYQQRQITYDRGEVDADT